MSWRSEGNAVESSGAVAEPPPGAPPVTPQPLNPEPLRAELPNVPAAVRALQQHGVIAIPTDTLYGARPAFSECCLSRQCSFEDAPATHHGLATHRGRAFVGS